MSNDLINGLFELVGGIFLILNLVALYKHKELKGVHWGPTVFFTLWGYWNLHYYPSLDQWFSFFGGIIIATINTIWLSMILYYTCKKGNKCTNYLKKSWIKIKYLAENFLRLLPI